ncbi:hypothetical protein GCM10012275_31080 [Longimycelium tulufanense]|uniref:DUF1996 domain-containing protein n=1 Tax=Longimycelium tulufanense TaxID=907463 RepID=A0A8J3CFF2_9PSEU|nr:DUF1996 domain-containing protein [Longimycelium tulufanense]GGM57659.1 hypothetical protein GCM10012275_31080 [Longimycelium tulufanense]
MHRLGRPAVVLALAALFATVTATGASATDDRSFDVTCSFSHEGPDDPIVYHGQPGASHHHMFFGNTSTNAYSTGESLYVNGDTTCDTPYDLSGYWTPDLRVDGRSVRPSYMVATYEARGKNDIEPFPFGLKMIAGDAHAHQPSDPAIVKWNCDGNETGGSSYQVPSCGWWQYTTLRYNFPDCWDGKNLDSPDHQSHMAHSRNGRCPSSHPREVPGVRMEYGYSGISNPGGVTLSSGDPKTAHADIFNAWDPLAFAGYVGLFLS